MTSRTPKPPPWKRRNPRYRTAAAQKLTDAQKAAARRRAPRPAGAIRTCWTTWGRPSGVEDRRLTNRSASRVRVRRERDRHRDFAQRHETSIRAGLIVTGVARPARANTVASLPSTTLGAATKAATSRATSRGRRRRRRRGAYGSGSGYGGLPFVRWYGCIVGSAGAANGKKTEREKSGTNVRRATDRTSGRAGGGFDAPGSGPPVAWWGPGLATRSPGVRASEEVRPQTAPPKRAPSADPPSAKQPRKPQTDPRHRRDSTVTSVKITIYGTTAFEICSRVTFAMPIATKRLTPAAE